MPLIREAIVTTVDTEGRVQIAPLGLVDEAGHIVIAPFLPSTTADNLRQVAFAVANYTDDARLFAGCLTGRRDWPVVSSREVPVPRLRDALCHAELEVMRIDEDELRPRFHCRVVHEVVHRPFRGMNRARAAVIEAAILVSRLRMLPRDKIEQEIAYLEIAVAKTAGPEEREAWDWLMERVRAHFA